MIGRGRNLSAPRDEIILRVRGNQSLRLDRYLRENMAWRSRTRIQALIRSGHVTVNNRSVKPSLVVRPGDEIRVTLSMGTGMPDYSRETLDVLYEDPWLLAINKPPGRLVHPVGRHVYDTLLNILHYRYREHIDGESAIHPRLCHRIDRDTTGILLVGKDRFVHQSVQWQLENRRVGKEYWALVSGRLSRAVCSVDRPLREGQDLRTALEGPGLKPSRTRLDVLERFEFDGACYTWVAARPVTGRQNQIRVHLASTGHPIVGDRRYGGCAPPAGFPDRFLLHARKLRFRHPRLKSAVELRAPLPRDVETLLGTVRGSGRESAAGPTN